MVNGDQKMVKIYQKKVNGDHRNGQHIPENGQRWVTNGLRIPKNGLRWVTNGQRRVS